MSQHDTSAKTYPDGLGLWLSNFKKASFSGKFVMLVLAIAKVYGLISLVIIPIYFGLKTNQSLASTKLEVVFYGLLVLATAYLSILCLRSKGGNGSSSSTENIQDTKPLQEYFGQYLDSMTKSLVSISAFANETNVRVGFLLEHLEVEDTRTGREEKSPDIADSPEDISTGKTDEEGIVEASEENEAESSRSYPDAPDSSTGEESFSPKIVETTSKKVAPTVPKSAVPPNPAASVTKEVIVSRGRTKNFAPRKKIED
ncbi:MAG: hypothetical protein G01um101418_362 [Parcubacteria group bacterium Gr01-1014_18]|nr:MAG: hypothetical protein Greene041636_262 [Parcubacteria group bacterium Greene0416_36]TSC81222.1 MAG: hypothetical protein G01um101418_362 [Parcubacteria group bacterium Gr01-1014_18]TSC99219.1 MAG: hypothetical protein Greene101420_364 [Parcubacteria group bacterium Greene1014_20]TSD07423.1 MAG: hypothetical protein Greene07142_122 [Parcubacteria group bacterium Greene0714_2]